MNNEQERQLGFADGMDMGLQKGILIGKVDILYNTLKLTPAQIAVQIHVSESVVNTIIANYLSN